MLDESEFIDINAEMKLFESISKEDNYLTENSTKRNFEELVEESKNIAENKIENLLNYEILSKEEKKLIDKINQNISIAFIADSTSVLQYGMEAQIKISNFSDSVLERIKNKNLAEIGNILIDLVTEIKSFDYFISKNNSKFLNIFKNTKKQLKKLISNYNIIQDNIDNLENNLESHRLQMLKDIIVFDEMYQKNLEYFKNLSLYIIAGQRKLEELKNITLPESQRNAETSGEQTDIQKVNDIINIINRFEKRIYDLKTTRLISLQMAPQIRLLQNNESELVEKIQSSLTNTIPLWKNQIVLALGITNSKQALDAEQTLSNTTNRLLQKDSKLLKHSSIKIAQESERTIIDIETLNKTNKNILETLEQIIKIHTDGNQKRLEAEKELVVIEEDLKQKLHQIEIKSNIN